MNKYPYRSDYKKLQNIRRSKAYQIAAAKASSWKEEIVLAEKEEIEKIHEEKEAFFSAMKEKTPELYAIFKSQDLELSEIAYYRLTGKTIILD